MDKTACKMPITLLVVVLMTSVMVGTDAVDCNHYRGLDPSYCTAAHQQKTEYQKLDSLLKDAHGHGGPSMDFLWNITLEMYLYLHPCAKRAEAALVFFYGYSPPPSTASWWTDMEHIMNAAIVGRRRRDGHSYTNDESLIQTQLRELVQATSAHCMQKLIDENKDLAATGFKSKFPGFLIPSGSQPLNTPKPTAPTTTQKPTTTHIPATQKPTTHIPATHKPTTHIPATQKPTTHKPATHKPTTHTHATHKPTTHTPATHEPPTTPSSAAGPLLCSKCTDLRCLTTNPDHTVGQCAHPDDLCFIRIKDTTTRQIFRGCTSRLSCESTNYNSQNCHNVEHGVIDENRHCFFCCHGDRCNLPPSLLPERNTLYKPSHRH